MRRLLWVIAVVIVSMAPILPASAQGRIDPPVAPSPPPGAAPSPPDILVIPRPAPITHPILARETAGTLRGFVADLFDGLDVYWGASFAREGVGYRSAQLMWVTVAESVVTACHPVRHRGSHEAVPPPPDRPQRVIIAPAAYCDADQTIYLSQPFLEHWWARSQGMAVVLTLAITWGNHVQNLLGIGPGDYDSTQLDLQADCFAGMFVRYTNARGWLRPGDREEAIRLMRESPNGWAVPGETNRLAAGSDERASAFESGYAGISCAGFTPLEL